MGLPCVKVYRRCVYGTWRTYILGDNHRTLISAITGNLTLVDRHVAALRALGFRFKVVPAPEDTWAPANLD